MQALKHTGRNAENNAI